MSLNGGFLLGLLIVLTVAAFTGVVLLWPRLSGKNWKAVLGRIGVLAGAQLMLVALLGAASNDYFGFYATWHDLLGLTSAPEAVAHDPAGGPNTRKLVTVQSVDGLSLSGGDVPTATGEVQNVTILGAATGLSTQAIVYLPPQYFQPAYRHYQFPAAIVSTGYPGTLTALQDKLMYPYRLLSGINNHQDKPIVLIMVQPSPTSVGGTDTECTDVPGGPQVNTFWAQDIPLAIENEYPKVTTAASGWGAIGDSTGGDCALKVAMMNSDRLTVAVSLSGDYSAPQDITTGDLYGADAQYRQTNNPLWRAEHLPKPPISVLLTSSKNGEGDYGAVLRFVRATEGSPTHTSTLIRNEGGHNFNTWNAEIPPAMQWLTNTLQSPTAQP